MIIDWLETVKQNIPDVNDNKDGQRREEVSGNAKQAAL